MRKRILSLTLAVAMLSSMFGTISTYAAAMFNDVSGHWAQATIEELAGKGIINGKGEGVYDPEGQVTRAEFTKLLVSTAETDFQNVDGELMDVNKDDWYNSYVYEALDRSVFFLNELENNHFYPDSPADRETVAVWSVRLLGVESETATTPFVDSASIENKTAVATAYNYGIITGDAGANTFRPKDTLTRAEAAVIVKRIMEKYNEMHSPRISENIVDYNDEVVSIDGESGVNKLETYDEAENKYVFSNIDDTIKNLQVGDVFIVESCDLIPGGVAIKVKTIDISGTNATIYGDEDIALEEVVDVIDISQETAITFENMDAIALAEGVTVTNQKGQTFAMAKAAQANNMYLADNSEQLLAQSSAGVGESLSFGIDMDLGDNANISGTFTLDAPRLHTDIDYGAIKGLKKLEVKVITSESKKVKLECSGSVGAKLGKYSIDNGIDVVDYLAAGSASKISDEQEVRQHLASMDIPIGTTPFIATVGLYAKVSLSGEVTVEITQSVKHTMGFCYEDSDLSLIYEKENSIGASVDAEGKVEAGVEFEVGISLLKVVSVSCDAGVGLGAKASANIISVGASGSVGTSGISGSVSGDTAFTGGGTVGISVSSSGIEPSKEFHRCRLCLDGDIYIYADITAKATIGVGKVSFTPFSKTVTILDEKNAKIKDFYVSVHEKNSPFLKFDWGDCPYVFKAPSVDEQPEDASARLGESATFETKGKNNAFSDDELGTSYDYEKGLIYQWYKDGAELAGQTHNFLSVDNVSEDSVGEYYCVIALEEYPELKTETKKVKLTINDNLLSGGSTTSSTAKTSALTGSVSEKNPSKSFTYVAPATGTYTFVNAGSGEVFININGEYRTEDDTFELEGGKVYEISVEWFIEDTNFIINIIAPHEIQDVSGNVKVSGQFEYEHEVKPYKYAPGVSGVFKFDAGEGINVMVKDEYGYIVSEGNPYAEAELYEGSTYYIYLNYPGGTGKAYDMEISATEKNEDDWYSEDWEENWDESWDENWDEALDESWDESWEENEDDDWYIEE